MRSCFLFIAAFMMLCGSLSAQQKDSVSGEYTLGQITVSATRYPEKVLEIPYAVSVINSSGLKDVRGLGLNEVLSSVPGVLAQSRAGGQDVRIVIRGFGARGAGDRSNAGTSRGIRVMQDGIPETEPDGRTSFDMLDLSLAENVEVVRSNASALWGNAAGGIINVSSIPVFTDYYGDFRSSFGSFGFRKFNLKAGTAIGAGKLFLSLSDAVFDGWREHSAGKKTVFNIGLVSALTPGTSLGVFVTASGSMFHIPGPLSQAEYDADQKQANSTYKNRDERRYNRLGRIGVTLDHSINEANEISGMVFINPKYLQRSERGTYRDFTRYHLGGNLLYRNKITVNSSIVNHFTLGADEAYQDGAILFYSLSSTNGRGSTLRDNKREGANNFGAFIQDEFIWNDKLSIIAGGRYDNITYYSENFLNPVLGLNEKSFERFTPKAGITYRITPLHSIYANLGGGVEVPAGNETDPAGTYGLDTVYLLNPLLEPIKSTTFEIGTKQLIMNDDAFFLKGISYDLALYYILIENDIIPYRGGRFYFTAGKTKRMGAELGADIQLNYGISLKGSLTYSDNKYTDYKVDSAHYGKAGKFADYSENKVAGIPDLFYSAALYYQPEFFKYMTFGVSVNGMGRYFADDANTLEVPSYNIINLSAVSEDIPLGSHLSLRAAAAVNNLSDVKYAAGAFINPDIVNGRPVFLEPGLPSNYTLSFSIAWK